MDYAKESLRLHKEWKGKIQVVTNVPVETQDDLFFGVYTELLNLVWKFRRISINLMN